MAVSNIKALIPGELQKVWELVLNTENYAAWRLSLIHILSVLLSPIFSKS